MALRQEKLSHLLNEYKNGDIDGFAVENLIIEMFTKPEYKQEELNEHDNELIRKSKNLHYVDWFSVTVLDAETKKGYEILRSIKSMLYHKEEASCGCL